MTGNPFDTPDYSGQAHDFLARDTSAARTHLEIQIATDLAGHYYLGDPLPFQQPDPAQPTGDARRGWAILVLYALAAVGAVTLLRAIF
jgi:hypothetical protein